MITLVVAKDIMQAHQFANEESEQRTPPVENQDAEP
jgi:hypothetical protein